MKTKIVMLKNLYTGEIVHTEKYQDVDSVKGVEFIMVYKPENPERKYYVNREAFAIVTK
jgi:hypothetical protein